MIIVFQSKLHSPRVLVLSNFAFTELVIFGSIKYIYDRLLSYCRHLEEIFVDSHILFHRVVGSKSVRQYIGFGCQEVHVEEHHMLVWHTPARCLIISDK